MVFVLVCHAVTFFDCLVNTILDDVLKDFSLDVKAIYRRAKAELGLGKVAECIRDCKRVIEIDPQNKDARDLLKQESPKDINPESKSEK